jgi:hypothetical protein
MTTAIRQWRSSYVHEQQPCRRHIDDSSLYKGELLLRSLAVFLYAIVSMFQGECRCRADRSDAYVIISPGSENRKNAERTQMGTRDYPLL